MSDDISGRIGAWVHNDSSSQQLEWRRPAQKFGRARARPHDKDACGHRRCLGLISVPAHGSPTRRARGFTLVELLIALAMVSLITLMLFSGLRLGSRAWEGVDAVSERISEVRVARDFLMTTFSQTRSTNLTIDGQMVSVFAGDQERLELAAPLSERVGVPGLYILRLGLEANGDDESLVLTRWLIHPEVLEGSGDIPAWEPLDSDSAVPQWAAIEDMDTAAGAFGRTLLLDRVADFEIAYFGTLDGEVDPDWHDEWLRQSTMPTLLRVRLGTPAQAWPDLIVSIPARLF
jgi:general secretion pathway protein J